MLQEWSGAELAECSGVDIMERSGQTRVEQEVDIVQEQAELPEWSASGVDRAERSGAKSAEWSGKWKVCMIRVEWTECSGGDD